MEEFERAKSPQENLLHIFIRECARAGMGVCKASKNLILAVLGIDKLL